MKMKKLIIDVIGIANVSRSSAPEGFPDKIRGYYTYEDTSTLGEDLFSLEDVVDKAPKLTKAENDFLLALRKEMEEKDCSYFRFI